MYYIINFKIWCEESIYKIIVTPLFLAITKNFKKCWVRCSVKLQTDQSKPIPVVGASVMNFAVKLCSPLLHIQRCSLSPTQCLQLQMTIHWEGCPTSCHLYDLYLEDVIMPSINFYGSIYKCVYCVIIKLLWNICNQNRYFHAPRFDPFIVKNIYTLLLPPIYIYFYVTI